MHCNWMDAYCCRGDAVIIQNVVGVLLSKAHREELTNAQTLLIIQHAIFSQTIMLTIKFIN